MTHTPPKIVLDCDPGIDDTLALVYLAGLHHAGEIKLAAVTTTAGNTDVDTTARNAAWVLDQCGLGGIPVAAGQPGPAHCELVTTPETHGPWGMGYVRVPGSCPRSGVPWHQLWASLADAHLIITGPLTNAAACLSWPGFPTVTVMGGAFDYPGNTTLSAEWNFWVDPHAARDFFRTQGPAQCPTVCSLGVTEQMLVGPDELGAVVGELGECAIAKHLPEILRFYFEFHRDQGLGYQAQIHDLLTCMIALGTISYDAEDAHVGVLCDGDDRGTSVRAPVPEPAHGSADVSADADADAGAGASANARVVTGADIAAAHQELLRAARFLAQAAPAH